MIYKINVYLTQTNDFNEKYTAFFKLIDNKYKILSKEYIFYDNTNFENYNPKSINSYIELEINSNSREFETEFSDLCTNYSFIKNFTINQFGYNLSNDQTISITPDQLNRLVDTIDKLFYIRKNIFDNLKNRNIENIQSILNDLSNTKYKLKSNVISLRFTDLQKELENIETYLHEYSRKHGIDCNISFSTNIQKIDKLIFSKLKPCILSIFNLFINEELELKKKSIDYRPCDINIYFSQKFNKLSILIKNSHIKQYIDFNLYSRILENESINLSKDIRKNEKEMSLINYFKTINELNGRIYLDENYNIVSKIRLNYLNLNALVVKNDNIHLVIDKNSCEKLIDFDDNNIYYLNDTKYYGYDNYKFPIINYVDNASNVLILKIDKGRYAFLVNKVLYEQNLFVRTFNTQNGIYLGYCLLKDTKKAYIINLKSLLLERKNEKKY